MRTIYSATQRKEVQFFGFLYHSSFQRICSLSEEGYHGCSVLCCAVLCCAALYCAVLFCAAASVQCNEVLLKVVLQSAAQHSAFLDTDGMDCRVHPIEAAVLVMLYYVVLYSIVL
jgi:hypothetical protein